MTNLSMRCLEGQGKANNTTAQSSLFSASGGIQNHDICMHSRQHLPTELPRRSAGWAESNLQIKAEQPKHLN